MIDDDLLKELDAAAASVHGVVRLSAGSAESYSKRLAEIYVTDTNHHWWWESISEPAKHIPYGNADGLIAIAGLVDSECAAVLVATDDEEPPWPAYAGTVKNLLAMLRDCRFFEYFIAAEDGRWIIFDTHMNELVAAGTIGA